jgi:hypothetical protein
LLTNYILSELLSDQPYDKIVQNNILHTAMSLNMSGHAHFGLQRLYNNKYNRHSYMESLI